MPLSSACCQFFTLRHALTMKTLIVILLAFLGIKKLKNVCISFENGTGDIIVAWG
jgi:hypothetical protein